MECHLDQRIVLVIVDGTQDEIETMSATIAKMGVDDLHQHGLRNIETEIAKDINPPAVAAAAEVAVLEEIDHPIMVARQVGK